MSIDDMIKNSRQYREDEDNLGDLTATRLTVKNAETRILRATLISTIVSTLVTILCLILYKK